MSKEYLKLETRRLNETFKKIDPNFSVIVDKFTTDGKQINMMLNAPFFFYMIDWQGSTILVSDVIPITKDEELKFGGFYKGFMHFMDGGITMLPNNPSKVDYVFGLCKFGTKSETHIVITSKTNAEALDTLEKVQGAFEGKKYPVSLPYLQPQTKPSRAPSDAEFRQGGAGITGVRKRRKIKSPKRLKL